MLSFFFPPNKGIPLLATCSRVVGFGPASHIMLPDVYVCPIGIPEWKKKQQTLSALR